MALDTGFIKSTWQTLVTDTSSEDLEGVGTIRFGTDGKVYRWVRNVEGSALTVGQVGFYDLSDTAGMARQEIVQANTADLGGMAGVVLATSLADDYYGWIQVLGYTASISVSGATTGGTDIAIGDYLKGSNGASYLVRDAATQALYGSNVQILESVATTTTPAAAHVKGIVNCL